MTVKAHAKINWALRVTGKRANGYHELDMLMQEISLYDTLEINRADRLIFRTGGVTPVDADKNLAVRAVRALEAHTGRLLPVSIDLTKRIPSRAGLGGGSSDCAAVLKTVNTLYALGLSQTELAGIGLTLGADVPYFIYGGFCRVKGIGENVCPVLRTPKYTLLMVHAGGGLSTPEVFARSDALSDGFSGPLNDGIAGNIARGCFEGAENDLERAAFELEPETGRVLEKLRGLPGALHARMSGSGSAVYAVFESEIQAQKAAAGIKSCVIACTI